MVITVLWNKMAEMEELFLKKHFIVYTNFRCGQLGILILGHSSLFETSLDASNCAKQKVMRTHEI